MWMRVFKCLFVPEGGVVCTGDAVELEDTFIYILVCLHLEG